MLFDDNHVGKVCIEAYERTTFFANKTRWENNFHKSYGKKIAKLLFITIFQQGKITRTRFLKLNETTVTWAFYTAKCLLINVNLISFSLQ